MKLFSSFLVFLAINMKNICLGLIFLIGGFVYYNVANQKNPQKDSTAIYKSLPPHEQKMVRIIEATKSLYIANQDYNSLSTGTIKKAYPESGAGGESLLTNIQKGDFEGVEIFVSPEDPKIAVFTLKNHNFSAGLKSMQNNFVKLNMVPNASSIQCSPDGYVIKSYPIHT